jgi:hypothetical protein
MLHYYAKNFLAPVLPSPYVAADGSGDVIVELISDSFASFSGTLTVEVFKFDDMSPGLSEAIDVQAVS